jgi:hypothetical protein
MCSQFSFLSFQDNIQVYSLNMASPLLRKSKSNSIDQYFFGSKKAKTSNVNETTPAIVSTPAITTTAISTTELPNPNPAPPSKLTKSTPKPKKKKPMTQEQYRRKMGDAVKSRLSMEKYCMKADCHAVVKVPIHIFKNLVVPNSVSVTPEVFNEETPVVVASIEGALAAGEVFGKSKIKGGNRYETCEVEKVEFVYFPSTEEARLWWIMYPRWYEDEREE